MNQIDLVMASAGSGKTTRLVAELEAALTGGAARPEAILATTFTRKAAAELVERARTTLIADGRAADAERLSAARIGTVNAVCGRLVSDFAFELGVSPEVRVLDEEMAAAALARSLAEVMEGEAERELAALAERMPTLAKNQHQDGWSEHVRRIVELARSNGIEAAALGACAEKSAASITDLLDPTAADGTALDAALAAAIRAFVGGVDPSVDGTGVTRDAVSDARAVLASLESGRRPAWPEWAKLSNLKTGKRSSELAEPLREAARAYDVHPLLRADLTRAITLVFDVAASALGAYERHKRAWGVIDFVDQEVMALALLSRPDVRAQLAHELDLVLIDEFQDTSPLQLALFFKLGEVAKRSVWVGDPKQAIFGFRGTDPALMGRALELFDAGGTDPELVHAATRGLWQGHVLDALRHSHRSRPRLVELTSELFARAFVPHGFAEEHVRLAPATADEPAGLGCVLEHWRLSIPNRNKKTEYTSALAALVEELLADASVRVRDRTSGEVRRLSPRDIAVLGRRQKVCAGVARALGERGIPAVLPRAGLSTTPEVRLATAALRLFVAPDDVVAKLELARLVRYPDRPDEWLEAVLSAPRAAVLDSVPEIERIRAAPGRAHLGPVEALHAALSAVGARELCRRWGNAAQRLANLDVLVAVAQRYVATNLSQGGAATVTGLLLHLQELEGSGAADVQAVALGEEAVTVSTWHAAKGLEWPITVLVLEPPRAPSAFGTMVVSERATVDPSAPLAGRWIRYWPTPFHAASTRTTLHERLTRHPAQLRAEEEDAREQLRLLYVGWTRARDRLILATPEDGHLPELLATVGDAAVGLEAGPVTWAGVPFELQVRRGAPLPPRPVAAVPGEAYLAPPPRTHPPAFARPSDLRASGVTVGAAERLGERVPLRAKADMAQVGNAIHAFLAADPKSAGRAEVAAAVLERWGAADALVPQDLVRIAERLDAWLARRWPDSRRLVEWPILRRLPSGTELRGAIDLVIDHPSGAVIIDHKSFPGELPAGAEHLASFGGQLRAYAEALALATGKPVTGTYVHLALQAKMIELHAT